MQYFTHQGAYQSTGIFTINTLPDGTVQKNYTNGAVETIKPDGTVIIKLPDGTTTTTLPDGTVIKALPDGTIIKTLPDGTIITTMPDGTIIKTLPETQGVLKNSLLDMAQNDIELNCVVAGLSGWGLASSRPSNGKSVLNRKAFRQLYRDKELRRFTRWKEGRFEDFMHGSASLAEREEFPLNSFQLLNFINRRIYGAETRN